MDNHQHHQTQAYSLPTNKRRHGRAFSSAAGGEGNRDREDQIQNDGGGGESEVWNAFRSNFQEVQSVLDRNRALIQQVNANHQSRVHQNLMENVSLINEINTNISKVVALYTNLSTNFSSAFNQNKTATNEDQSNSQKANR